VLEEWENLFREMQKLTPDSAEFKNKEEIDFQRLHVANSIWNMKKVELELKVAEQKMLITKALYLSE